MDVALSAETTLVVVPTVAFIYPPAAADKSTPPAVVPEFLHSALRAEDHLYYFTERGRRGVALRLSALYGPHAATAMPTDRYTAHLHTLDAAAAIAAAFSASGGVYNVTDDADPSAASASPKPSAGTRGTEATDHRPSVHWL